MKFTFENFMNRERQRMLFMVARLERTTGPDIFKVILSFLSDFDLVEFEGWWGGDIISKYAEDLLNKRVGDSSAHNIMAHYNHAIIKYSLY